MLHLSQAAVVLLDAAKRQYRIPVDYGIRVSGASTTSGDPGIQIDFTGGPDDGDLVEEQHGAMVFVAADVAEPLADAELDVSPSVSGNGARPVTLVLLQNSDDG